jgi:hypothetical protein
MGGEGVGIVTATMRAAMRYWNGSDVYTFRTCRHQRGRRPGPAGGIRIPPATCYRAPPCSDPTKGPLPARALLPPLCQSLTSPAERIVLRSSALPTLPSARAPGPG